MGSSLLDDMLWELSREEAILRRLGAPNIVFALNHTLREQLRKRPVTQLTGFIIRKREGWFFRGSPFPTQKKYSDLPVTFEEGVDPPEVQGIIRAQGSLKGEITGELHKGKLIPTRQVFVIQDWDEDHTALWNDFKPLFTGPELLDLFDEVVSLPSPLSLELLLSPISSPNLDHYRSISGGCSVLIGTSSLKLQEVDSICETVTQIVPAWHLIDRAPGFEFVNTRVATPDVFLPRLRKRQEPRELSAVLGLDQSSSYEFANTVVVMDDPIIVEEQDVAFHHGRHDFYRYKNEIQFSLLCLHTQLQTPFQLTDLHSSFESRSSAFLESFRENYPYVWQILYKDRPEALRLHDNRQLMLGRLLANRARFYQQLLNDPDLVHQTFRSQERALADLENALEIGHFSKLVEPPPKWGQRYQTFHDDLFSAFDAKGELNWTDIRTMGQGVSLSPKDTRRFLRELIREGILYSADYDPETCEGNFKRT